MGCTVTTPKRRVGLRFIKAPGVVGELAMTAYDVDTRQEWAGIVQVRSEVGVPDLLLTADIRVQIAEVEGICGTLISSIHGPPFILSAAQVYALEIDNCDQPEAEGRAGC